MVFTQIFVSFESVQYMQAERVYIWSLYWKKLKRA